LKIDGKKTVVPHPAVVALGIHTETDDQGRKSTWVTEIKAAKQADQTQIIDIIKKFSAIGTSTGQYGITVQRGKVVRVMASKNWEVEDELLPVSARTNHKKDEDKRTVPVMGIRLKTSKNNMVTAYLDARNLAAPDILIDDFYMLLEEASKTWDDPVDQANLLDAALKDREIIVIGSQGKVSTNDDHTISMSVYAYALIEVPQAGIIETLADLEKLAPAPKQETAPKQEQEEQAKDQEPVAETPKRETAAEEIEKKIKFVAGSLLGSGNERNLSKIPIEQLVTRMGFSQYPESVVKQVYEDMIKKYEELKE
jgi:hypothetical protein